MSQFSVFFWYFPTPNFCKYGATELKLSEKWVIIKFQDILKTHGSCFILRALTHFQKANFKVKFTPSPKDYITAKI